MGFIIALLFCITFFHPNLRFWVTKVNAKGNYCLYQRQCNTGSACNEDDTPANKRSEQHAVFGSCKSHPLRTNMSEQSMYNSSNDSSSSMCDSKSSIYDVVA